MKKIAIIFIAALGLCSCTEDFLTKNPLGVQSSATYYNDPQNCQKAVNAVYDPLGWMELYNEMLWKIGDLCSDDCERGGGEAKVTYTTGDDWQKSGQLVVFEADGRNGCLNDIWKAAYLGIARANVMLQSTEGTDNDEIKKMRAEVRFLRAWYYFTLTKVFGPVILSDGPVSVEQSKDLGNRDGSDDGDGSKQISKQYNYIISELEAIKGDLPLTVSAAERGKITQAAVRFALAKVYLYNKQYDKAFNTAYDLYTECNDKDYALEAHYQDIFCFFGEANEGSKEVVWAIQNIAGQKYNREGDGSIVPIYVAPRYYVDPGSGSPMKEDVLGYGFAMPTQNLVDEFEAGDPRASMIIAAPGDGGKIDASIAKLNLDTKAFITPAAIKGTDGWYTIGKVDWNTGYYCQKRTQVSELIANSGYNTQCSGKDYIVFRWAELMLVAAEAGVQCGHDAEALTLVNKLRERARKSVRTIDYAADKSAAISGACYTYTGVESANPAALASVDLNAVKKERRVELYCEGERFFDLIRWDETEKFRTEDISGYKFKYNPATLGRWPIPQAQIILHEGGNLKQNPGY